MQTRERGPPSGLVVFASVLLLFQPSKGLSPLSGSESCQLVYCVCVAHVILAQVMWRICYNMLHNLFTNQVVIDIFLDCYYERHE